MNNTAYADVIAASSLITSAGIISVNQLNFFLRKRGLNEQRMDSVKKILLREGYAFSDPSNMYFSSSSVTDYRKFTEELKKSVWLFIDSLPEMNYVNFKCKIPCVAYFCNSGSIGTDDFNDFTVFYIKNGTEAVSNRIINTNFGSETSKINSIIIIDSPEQIDLIRLEDPINIVSFAVVSNDGRIQYYN